MSTINYLSEIRKPNIILTDASDEIRCKVEINNYLSNLETLRFEFIDTVSNRRELTAISYIDELVDIKKRYENPHASDLLSPSMYDTIARIHDKKGFALVGHPELVDRVLIRIKASIERTFDFLKTSVPEELYYKIAGYTVVRYMDEDEDEYEDTSEANNTTAASKKTYNRQRTSLAPEREATPKSPKATSLAEVLYRYGEFLTVEDLIAIFHVDRRTIFNWEKAGWLVNVSKTSEETTAAGRKKRGQEKRFRKDEVIKSVELQTKFNGKP